MINPEKPINTVSTQREVLYGNIGMCEVIRWFGQDQPARRLIYIPGLPGDTMTDFGEFAKRWIIKDPQLEVLGVLHSGIIDNSENSGLFAGTGRNDNKIAGGLNRVLFETTVEEAGAYAENWINDVSTVIETNPDGIPLTLVGHSFGGIFALLALADVIREERLPKNRLSKLRLILISVPAYLSGSLPDRKPLEGTDPVLPFTFFNNPESEDKMSQTDDRIPMASRQVFAGIEQFLAGGSMSINPRYHGYLNYLFDYLPAKLEKLKDSGIPIATLIPFQDRWIGRQAGLDLEEMIMRPIQKLRFDLPSSYYPELKKTNAHDLVPVWAPYIEKLLSV